MRTERSLIVMPRAAATRRLFLYNSTMCHECKGYSYSSYSRAEHHRGSEWTRHPFILWSNSKRLLPFHVFSAIAPAKIRTIGEMNREHAARALEFYGRNRSKAAEVLGISRTSLRRTLKED